MRTQKAVFRRTRRGNVSLVASEQYLREDLPCGLASCGTCDPGVAVLDGGRPVLVLEAGVLEAQLDLFRDGLFGNCVVPLSALAALEAGAAGAQAAREARATIAEEGRARGLFVFGDLHHAQVQSGRAAGEGAAAWRRRQAEAVAAFYRAHAPGARVLVVADAEAFAREHAPELLGRVAWVEADEEAAALFAPHLSRALLEEGLREGRLRECRFYESCVDVATGEEVRLADANRTLPGDRVAVDAAGRVVGILSRRAGRALVGTAHGTLFTAQDGQRVRLRVPAAERRRLVCAVDCWPCHRPEPLGHVARDLGELHSAAAEQAGVLLAHEVRAEPFSPQQLAELPPPDARPGLDAPWREDLRALCVASVDPPGCTDIDDALHARPLPGGLFEVRACPLSLFFLTRRRRWGCTLRTWRPTCARAALWTRRRGGGPPPCIWWTAAWTCCPSASRATSARSSRAAPSDTPCPSSGPSTPAPRLWPPASAAPSFAAAPP